MNYKEVLQLIEYPPTVLVLDFESYFTQEYSFKKMSTIEYICHRMFDFTGLGYQILNTAAGDLEPKFVGKDEIDSTIKGFQKSFGVDFDTATVVILNAKFDITILKEKFGINPPYVIDILDLVRHYDSRMNHHLKDLAKMFGLKPKGDTQQFKGLHYEKMEAIQKEALGIYNITDITIEASLFKILLPLLSNPIMEVSLARHTLGLFLNPRIRFDFQKAKELANKMSQKLNDIIEETGYSKDEISGNISFVNLLKDALPAGEDVPMKPGKKGMIPALAQQDDGRKYLLAHPDEKVRQLMSARLAIKSWPLHVKRIWNMTNQTIVSKGYLRVPLHYYGAHTGRWSGGEKINVQNLGGRGRVGSGVDPLISEMRQLLCTPDGYTFIISDSAQIEARVLAWLAGQEDLLDGFRNGEDIYSVFATQLFGCEVRKPKKDDTDSDKRILKIRRGFGKDAILGCVAKHSPVLTLDGWRRAENITANDLLWDGKQWVENAGIVDKGKQVCVNVNGVWLTPEHEVLNNHQWYQAAHLATNNQALTIDLEISRLQKLNLEKEVGLSPLNAFVPVVEQLLRREIIWSQENLHAVISVLKKHLGKLRLIKQKCQIHIVQDFLTEFVQSLAGVIQSPIEIMANGESNVILNGLLIESCFLNTWSLYQDGIIPNLKSTELIMIKDTNQAILGSSPILKICETVDILYSGPYKRFQCGNMIVANCGYGMGAKTFYERCRQNPDLRPLFDSGEYTYKFIEDLIKTYRTTYKQIPAFWKVVEKCFKWVTKYPNEVLYYPSIKGVLEDRHLLTFWNNNGTVNLQLPSGRILYYRHSRLAVGGGYSTIQWHWGHLWGGSITENIVQAVARDLLGYWILEVEKNNLPVVLTNHDEIVVQTPNIDGELKLQKTINLMSHGPDWSEGLPLSAEGELSDAYKK